jgi:hypothetical protein
MKDPQTILMTTMAENVPFKQMVIQVKRAIQEYEESYSEDRERFLIFVMQIAMMSHLMQVAGKNANDILSDLDKTDKLMDLFKENNN